MEENKVLVEVSARHVHLSREDLDVLFGKDYELTHKKDLSQPGQFACAERVDLVGPKSTINNVIILGPCRAVSQVEVSLTDARTLGENALIRESGKTEGTQGLTLIGPKGKVVLKEGLIAAKRHVHLTPEDALKFHVENGQVVSVKVETNERSTTFGDVVIRVSEKYAAAMHIDTDEANAAGIFGSALGEIVIA